MNLLHIEQLEVDIEKLETIIKDMATDSLRVCSMLVAAEVIKCIPSNTISKALMQSVKKLHSSCTQEAVKELFDKDN